MKVPYQAQLVLPFLPPEHRKFVAMKVPFVPVPVAARSSGVAMTGGQALSRASRPSAPISG